MDSQQVAALHERIEIQERALEIVAATLAFERNESFGWLQFKQQEIIEAAKEQAMLDKKVKDA